MKSGRMFIQQRNDAVQGERPSQVSRIGDVLDAADAVFFQQAEQLRREESRDPVL